MAKLVPLLFKFFLLSFPFSLHLVVYEQATYRFGNFNPWVTGFLFFPQLLLLLIVVLQQLGLRRQGKILSPVAPSIPFFSRAWTVFLTFFILNAALVTFWKGDSVLWGFFLLHLLCIFWVYRLMVQDLLSPPQIIRWLLLGAMLQVIIAFFQVKLNHSLGLSILGEPHLSPEILNVAKNNLEDGTKAIRGYGTFLHPNILGVYLMTILFVSLPYLKKLAAIFWPALLLFGIYLTGSQAAQLATIALFFLMLCYKFIRFPETKKWLTYVGLGLFFTLNAWLLFNSNTFQFEALSLKERLAQIEISEAMLKAQPWGVGVGNFTLEMENYSPVKLSPWEFQPVHNVYFMGLNQMGLQGFILLMLLIFLYLRSAFQKMAQGQVINILPFLGLLFVASFDHLLMTSYIGPLLIGLVLGLKEYKTS